MGARTPRVKLEAAARARYEEGLTWKAAARQAGVPERTLRRLRAERDPAWSDVVEELLAQMKLEALPTALGCLLRMARQNNVAAARILLDRYGGLESEMAHRVGPSRYAHLSDEELDAEIERLEREVERDKKAMAGEEEED